MKAKKCYFKECHVAGRQYHDANEVWGELKVGTRLWLVRDEANRYDPSAVAIVYRRPTIWLAFLIWGGVRFSSADSAGYVRMPTTSSSCM